MFKGAKFDHDLIKEKMLSGFEIFKFFVADHFKRTSDWYVISFGQILMIIVY